MHYVQSYGCRVGIFKVAPAVGTLPNWKTMRKGGTHGYLVFRACMHVGQPVNNHLFPYSGFKCFLKSHNWLFYVYTIMTLTKVNLPVHFFLKQGGRHNF